MTEFARDLEECVLWYPGEKQPFLSNYLFKMALGFSCAQMTNDFITVPQKYKQILHNHLTFENKM